MYWLLLLGKRILPIHPLGPRLLPARGPVTRRPRFLTGSFHAVQRDKGQSVEHVAEIFGTSAGSVCHHFCPPAAGPTDPQKVNVTRQGPQGETPGMDQQQPTSPMSPPGPGPGCAATGSSNLGQPSASFSLKAPSINKMHYIHTTDSDSAVNKDEALTHPARRVNLENRVLRERSPTQKGVCYVITFI